MGLSKQLRFDPETVRQIFKQNKFWMSAKAIITAKRLFQSSFGFGMEVIIFKVECCIFNFCINKYIHELKLK